MSSHSRDIAAELKQVIREAGRDPDALEHQLPALAALERVVAAGELSEPERVYFILHRLIPAYLTRLPDSRDCRAIRELLTWEGSDGEMHSLTTRYHKAAAHLVYAARDFGRRQEPRLLHECARRFVRFNHEDRLAAAPRLSPSRTVGGPDVAKIDACAAGVGHVPVDDPNGGPVGVHGNLDHHRLIDRIASGEDIVLVSTSIPGIDILADALAAALTRGATVLMLPANSEIASLRSRALQRTAQKLPPPQPRSAAGEARP